MRYGSRTGPGLAALALVALAATGAASGSGQDAIDVSKLGPQVGERVPDFTLPDQKGASHSLEALMGPKGLMLVFSRSADW